MKTRQQKRKEARMRLEAYASRQKLETDGDKEAQKKRLEHIAYLKSIEGRP